MYETLCFLLPIYESNESIDFVHGKSKKFEILDELELFVDTKVFLDEKNISVGPPPPRRLPSVSKF
jgi:hypothetical protein